QQGRLVGFYTVRKSCPTGYSQGEIRLALALAHHVTLAMELSRLAEEVRQAAVLQEREQAAAKRAAELSKTNQALLRTLDAVAAEPEIDRLLGTVIAAITDQLHAA